VSVSSLCVRQLQLKASSTPVHSTAVFAGAPGSAALSPIHDEQSVAFKFRHVQPTDGLSMGSRRELAWKSLSSSHGPPGGTACGT